MNTGNPVKFFVNAFGLQFDAMANTGFIFTRRLNGKPEATASVMGRYHVPCS